jgi:hypothetical protein
VAIVVASSHLSHLCGVGWQAMRWARLVAHIELENTGNHNDCLGTISILKHRKLEGFCAIDKKSTTNALLVLHDPISPAVLTDQEERNSRTRFGGGRLKMFHDTSP